MRGGQWKNTQQFAVAFSPSVEVPELARKG